MHDKENKDDVTIEELLGLEMTTDGTYEETESIAPIEPESKPLVKTPIRNEKEDTQLSDYEELLLRYGTTNKQDVPITATFKTSALPILFYVGGVVLSLFLLFVVVMFVAGESLDTLYNRK